MWMHILYEPAILLLHVYLWNICPRMKRACLRIYGSTNIIKILEIIQMLWLGNGLVNCDLSIILEYYAEVQDCGRCALIQKLLQRHSIEEKEGILQNDIHIISINTFTYINNTEILQLCNRISTQQTDKTDYFWGSRRGLRPEWWSKRILSLSITRFF